MHRALPTNTRFDGDGKCRLGCGCLEHFTHWATCKRIKPFWTLLANVINSLEAGRVRPNKLFIFFALREVDGELKVANRHVRGILWLAWKFLWQQLAAIGENKDGEFNFGEALTNIFRAHHSCVLAALYDHRLVRQEEIQGARKERARKHLEGERMRVWPFVTIWDTGAMTYTSAYKTILDTAKVKLSDEIDVESI